MCVKRENVTCVMPARYTFIFLLIFPLIASSKKVKRSIRYTCLSKIMIAQKYLLDTKGKTNLQNRKINFIVKRLKMFKNYSTKQRYQNVLFCKFILSIVATRYSFCVIFSVDVYIWRFSLSIFGKIILIDISMRVTIQRNGYANFVEIKIE